MLQHEAGELCDQRPQPGVFLQEADHAGIEIAIKAVFIAEPGQRRPVTLDRRRVQISHDQHPSTDKEPRRARINCIKGGLAPRRNFGRSVGKLERARAILPRA